MQYNRLSRQQLDFFTFLETAHMAKFKGKLLLHLNSIYGVTVEQMHQTNGLYRTPNPHPNSNLRPFAHYGSSITQCLLLLLLLLSDTTTMCQFPPSNSTVMH